MRCPACLNALSEVVAGDIMVDACKNGCGGIWFDNFELKKVDEKHEIAGETLLDIEKNDALVVDSTRKRECPRCEGMKLKKHFFSVNRSVEIDSCRACGGVWLDAGELEQIRNAFKDEKAKDSAAAGAFSNMFDAELEKMKKKSEIEAKNASIFKLVFGMFGR
ncbi:zf-TFIIB domain-containing protein [Candidatus Riflebacteria bacterium]